MLQYNLQKNWDTYLCKTDIASLLLYTNGGNFLSYERSLSAKKTENRNFDRFLIFEATNNLFVYLQDLNCCSFKILYSTSTDINFSVLRITFTIQELIKNIYHDKFLLLFFHFMSFHYKLLIYLLI